MPTGNYIIKNISQLLQIRKQGVVSVKGKEMAVIPAINNAWLIIEDGLIKAFGEMDAFNSQLSEMGTTGYETIDAKGSCVLPAYCDAHTHIVFAGWRAQEFVDRISGLSYQEIAARGGGILNSVRKLRDMDENLLFDMALGRLQEMQAMGTGAVEIKSGYGLSLESEIRMLKIIRRLKAYTPQTLKATFLGAHAVPEEFKNNKEGYITHLINDMLPRIAEEGLADYCDVFCEQNYFTADDTKRILHCANKFGIQGKVHAEQLSHTGGIAAGVQSKAISVDHLEFIDNDDIELLLGSVTMPVLLPGAAFFLGLTQPPARDMIDAGLPVALSTDYNPGSSPSGNMNMMLSFACVQMRMTPAEAYNAATINSAYAMGVQNELGSITIGKKANLILTQPGIGLEHIPYLFASTAYLKRVFV